MKRNSGFTLVESVMAMVLIAFAMVTLITFLYPQVERSASPHYQTRAANLGQSLMTQILARGFDEKSDFDGGEYRCGEPKPNYESNPCSSTLGRDSGESTPAQFNDVDDYIGCWYGENSSDCDVTGYKLADIFGEDMASKYKNFTVEIDVSYSHNHSMKKVELIIKTGRHGEFEFVGYRGNY